MGLLLICPQCQAKVGIHLQTCPQCGANLKNLPPEQRRYFLGQVEEVTAAAPEEKESPEVQPAVELAAEPAEAEPSALETPPEAPSVEESKAPKAEAKKKTEAKEAAEKTEKEPKKKKRPRKKKKTANDTE
ncbi:MAG: hypothetical protein ACLFUU_03750 [Desulfobacteraceae bacterium]